MAYHQYISTAVTCTAAHSELTLIRNNAVVCILDSMHTNDIASTGTQTVTHLAWWHLYPTDPAG